jgi:hypothetical protein
LCSDTAATAMVHDLLPVETVELMLSLVSHLNDDVTALPIDRFVGAMLATFLEELDARLQDLFVRMKSKTCVLLCMQTV